MARRKNPDRRPGLFRAYSFAWITTGFFIVSLVGHWLFAWLAFVAEQQAHAQPVQALEFFNQTMRDTLENWQSEFLQLIWQVGGLAILLHVGSPQSKEGSERVEAKLDELLRRVEPKEADKLIARLDRDFHRTG